MILIMWNTLACVRQLDHTMFPHLISFQGWTRPGHSVSSHRMNAPVPSLFEGTSSPHWVWGGTGKLQPPLEWESGVWGWKTKAAKAGDIRRRKTEQRENSWVMHTNAHTGKVKLGLTLRCCVSGSREKLERDEILAGMYYNTKTGWVGGCRILWTN